MTKTGPMRIYEEIQKNKTDAAMGDLLISLWELELEQKKRYKETYKESISKCAEIRRKNLGGTT